MDAGYEFHRRLEALRMMEGSVSVERGPDGKGFEVWDRIDGMNDGPELVSDWDTFLAAYASAQGWRKEHPRRRLVIFGEELGDDE